MIGFGKARVEDYMAMGYSYDDACILAGYRRGPMPSNLNNDTYELKSNTKKEEVKVSKKFYKVMKPNFMWQVGAILELKDNRYQPLEQNELWCMNEHIDGSDGIKTAIVENSPEYFERVYPVNLITKTIYKVKAEAMEFINKDYTEPTEAK